MKKRSKDAVPVVHTLGSAIAARFPSFAEVIGRKALETYANGAQVLPDAALWQMEQDIVLLQRHISQSEITRAYRRMLQNQECIETMYELRVAAMLSTVGHDMTLHAPLREANNDCDLQCMIEGTTIFVEITTRKDSFPTTYESGDLADATLRGRVTVEKEWSSTTAGDDPAVREIPASKELQEIIQRKAGQLPPGGANILVLGSLGGRSLDVEAALWGDEVLKANSLRPGARRERVPNGLFRLPDDQGGTSRISALVWMKLVTHFYDVRVHSRLFLNPLAVHPLSFAAEDVLVSLFDRREVLQQELDRIVHILVERYCPERIILFGSLVSSDSSDVIHQWSDIDLAIVKATPSAFMERIREVAELVRARVGVNIFVYTPEELARAEREGDFFIRDEILKKGRDLF